MSTFIKALKKPTAIKPDRVRDSAFLMGALGGLRGAE
jgi:hypothetical protein